MVGRKRGRGRPSRGGDTSRTSTAAPDDSDTEMADATTLPDDASASASPLPPDAAATSPPPGEDDEAPRPADDDDDDADADDADEPVVEPMPRRRRGPGRPPRASRVGIDGPGAEDEGSDGGTPRRRGRGGYRGGFRGRPRWGPKTAPDRHAIDKAGTTVDVVRDEAVLEEDAAGEGKVDGNGVLRGGRDYRVRVFTILGREERLYMLSTEPARCTGFRDSYLFFNKHLALHKVVLGDDEKMDLIERDVLPHSYKGRSIGVVTARSVFREFGARIIVGGRRVVDDYYETAARQRGDVEGEPADPNDRLPPPGEAYNKNQYVAWHGASQVYHTQPAQTGATIPTGKRLEGRRKTNLTVTNWQHEHASEASKFNSTLARSRRANLAGVYDTHTNLVLYPGIMQPTHAKWTPVTDDDDDDDEHPFRAPTALIARNYRVVDTVFLAPAQSTPGLLPGNDSGAGQGLGGVPAAVVAELPEGCRAGFGEAVAREEEWRARWGSERVDGARAELAIGFARFPVNL